jgi:hypothetical protein
VDIEMLNDRGELKIKRGTRLGDWTLGEGVGCREEEKHRTPIFTIRGDYSKYTKHYVIILFVE